MFYFQNKFAEIDTLLLIGRLLGRVLICMCFKESVPDKALFRGSSGVVISAIGCFETATRS